MNRRPRTMFPSISSVKAGERMAKCAYYIVLLNIPLGLSAALLSNNSTVGIGVSASVTLCGLSLFISAAILRQIGCFMGWRVGYDSRYTDATYRPAVLLQGLLLCFAAIMAVLAGKMIAGTL